MKKFLLSGFAFLASLNLMSVFILLDMQGLRTGSAFFILFLITAIISLITTLNYWNDIKE